MISHSIRAAALATGFAAAISCAGLSAHAASFDGPWSLLVVTRSGPCDQAYRYGVTIARGQVYYAGGGPVSFTVPRLHAYPTYVEIRVCLSHRGRFWRLARAGRSDDCMVWPE